MTKQLFRIEGTNAAGEDKSLLVDGTCQNDAIMRSGLKVVNSAIPDAWLMSDKKVKTDKKDKVPNSDTTDFLPIMAGTVNWDKQDAIGINRPKTRKSAKQARSASKGKKG